MQVDIKARVIEESDYIIERGATVRETAKVFHVGKSTVHKDVTERLKSVDPAAFKRVRKILEKNLAERHIRGGEATKRKYLAAARKKERKIT